VTLKLSSGEEDELGASRYGNGIAFHKTSMKRWVQGKNERLLDRGGESAYRGGESPSKKKMERVGRNSSNHTQPAKESYQKLKKGVVSKNCSGEKDTAASPTAERGSEVR